MSIDRMADSAALPSVAQFGRGRRRAVTHGDGGRMELLLRDALAREQALLHRLDELIQQRQDSRNRLHAWKKNAVKRIACLTPRQREIMDLVVAGHSNKNIARELGVSQRTVENHRAAIMKKTDTKSLPALVRFALAAARDGDRDQDP